ncbi:dioxygenase-like protein [Nocardia bhagyanarayanae]|uniref:Dioxygenase-like protein n=2 Tax=Nocardia bhagyanarayanae TaxID=1215925 RepID=A0A543FBM8_9NOCA|nr:dioxygenase-like protein [Nocardia bhagyanarayanae]
MGRNGGAHEHDLGLAHDLRVMSRRRALTFLGIAGAATAATACATATRTGTSSASTATSTASESSAVSAAPQETAGPYPGDGSNGPNVLIESGVVRSDITTSFGSYSGIAEGVPMTLKLSLRDLAKSGAAGAGMAVYVWHCDRSGAYSLYSPGVTDQNYLRGVQVADETGAVTFTSIFPACYSGRWPHIHFEVYDSLETAVAGSNARLTSQIALPHDVCEAVFAHDSGYAQSIRNMSGVSLASDNVFGDGWDAELATVTGTPASGVTVALTIGVAAKSENSSPGGDFGPPPGGRPGGPPPGR